MNKGKNNSFYDLANGCCQGWLLWKQDPKKVSNSGSFYSKWVKRWVAVNENAIYGYSKNDDAVQVNNADFHVDLNGYKVRFSSKRKFSFCISNGQQIQHFAALKEDDLWKWMNVFHYQVNQESSNAKLDCIVKETNGSDNKCNSVNSSTSTSCFLDCSKDVLLEVGKNNELAMEDAFNIQSTSAKSSLSSFDKFQECNKEFSTNESFRFNNQPSKSTKIKAASLPDLTLCSLLPSDVSETFDKKGTSFNVSSLTASEKQLLSYSSSYKKSEITLSFSQKSPLIFSRSLDSLLESKITKAFQQFQSKSGKSSKTCEGNSSEEKFPSQSTPSSSFTCFENEKYNHLRRRMTKLSHDQKLNEKLLHKRTLERQLKEKAIELDYLNKLLDKDKITRSDIWHWVNEHSLLVQELKIHGFSSDQSKLEKQNVEASLSGNGDRSSSSLDFAFDKKEKLSNDQDFALNKMNESYKRQSSVSIKVREKNDDHPELKSLKSKRKLSGSKILTHVLRKPSLSKSLSEKKFRLPHLTSKSSFSYRLTEEN